MDHRQRLSNCISGNKIDRPPVALWRHFPVEDQEASLLANAVIHFQETYDFDLVKVTPASSFCTKDWGVRDIWKGNPEGTREIIEFPIQRPEDWLKLKPNLVKNNHLSEQLTCVRHIRSTLPMTTPVIQTIFNPLSQAKSLVGKNNLPIHIRLYPDEVKYALGIITETTIEFIRNLNPLGIDGVFYALQHAQAGYLVNLNLRSFQNHSTSKFWNPANSIGLTFFTFMVKISILMKFLIIHAMCSIGTINRPLQLSHKPRK